MKRLFYVRHGESDMNVAGLFSGVSDATLTAKGAEQAKVTGHKIKHSLPNIDLIICSPLKRTRQTAKHIAEEINYPIDKIIYNELFIERNFGPLEGTKPGPLLRTAKHNDLDHIEGVESLEELQTRAKKALSYVTSLKDYDNILIVSHGTFGRALRRAVNKLPHTQEHEVFDPIDNAEILELV